MSIRKRLVLSNIAMVLIPVLLFIAAVLLLVSIFFGDIKRFMNFGAAKNLDTTIINQEFTSIKKVASLSPEQLEHQNYLAAIDQKLRKHHASIIIRKDHKIIFKSSMVKQLSISTLPSFGEDDRWQPVQWVGSHHYIIQSYDFYFSNGKKGTVFIARDAGTFIHAGRALFLTLFGVLLLILISTNGLLTYFVSRTIIKPVNKLIQAAQKIGEGDLDFQIGIKQKDELGKLAQTFDHMRQKLKESINVQLQYEENRKELIANISHDLKTPITSIKGYVEGIRDGVANTPVKMERYLNTIYTKSVDMDKLIDELALYSKLDMNRLPYHFEEVNIQSFLLELIDELTFDLENENVALFFHTNSSEPYRVLADREKIKRAVTNIVSNSLKYMDKDKKSIEISIKGQADESVVVQIKDNGPGISEEALPYIFERFYRADPSRNTGTGGSGLGLAIVRRIIEDHGGNIWVESKIGKGTSIFFTLKTFV
ncbi:sensor histidine kinase [Heyndrickxia ginsengihumi]|uniref:sensor histidine kinase n=1 Tax=Heyndrickxia ginsengihumi TaxID=363870 RepID=UPI003D1A9FF0